MGQLPPLHIQIREARLRDLTLPKEVLNPDITIDRAHELAKSVLVLLAGSPGDPHLYAVSGDLLNEAVALASSEFCRGNLIKSSLVKEELITAEENLAAKLLTFRTAMMKPEAAEANTEEHIDYIKSRVELHESIREFLHATRKGIRSARTWGIFVD